MRRYTVTSVGVFHENSAIPNGQGVRTSLVTNTLAQKYGESRVNRVTYKFWKKHPVRLMIKLIASIAKSENLLMFPDKNAIKIIAPLSFVFCGLFRTKLHYNVVGGWLPVFTANNRFYRNVLRGFDTIFVQTSYLKTALEKQGFQNIVLFPNFKPVKIADKPQEHFSEPYSCFFLSRVMKEKGIEELIAAIKEVNRDKVRFTLDIFGPFDRGYESEFLLLEKEFPEYIRYLGALEPLTITDSIKSYFLQIFPTKYRTEGFPGCVIDSYTAGVPVLASRWNSFDDVIGEGKTGLSYDFDSPKDLVNKLREIYDNPQKIMSMRENCINEAQKYKPDNIIKIMMERFQE